MTCSRATAIAELEQLVRSNKFDAVCVAAVKRHQHDIMAILDRSIDP